eukprot:15339479-Ditylum_brightwellii.AAC.1
MKVFSEPEEDSSPSYATKVGCPIQFIGLFLDICTLYRCLSVISFNKKFMVVRKPATKSGWGI